MKSQWVRQACAGAAIYLHAVERLTDDAAMGLSSQAWSSNAALQMRLASYRRQWANAGVVAIHLLPPQDQGKAVILDELALCLLQQVKNVNCHSCDNLVLLLIRCGHFHPLLKGRGWHISY